MIWITSAFSLFSQEWFQAEGDLECLPFHRVIILVHLINVILLLHWNASALVSSRTYQLSSSPRHPLMGSYLLILEVCWVCHCKTCLIFLVLPLPIPVPEVLWALILLSQKLSPASCSPLAGGAHGSVPSFPQAAVASDEDLFEVSSCLPKCFWPHLSPPWQRGWGCSLETQCWKELCRFAPLPSYSCKHWPALEPGCGAFLWFSSHLMLMTSPRIWFFNLLWRCRTGISCGHGSLGLFMKMS